MCEWGDTIPARLKIPADLSATGTARWRSKMIDRCIAPIVETLQSVGVDMRFSCCGHNKSFGNILLQDGRVLLILSPREVELYVNQGIRRSWPKVLAELLKEE